MLFTVKIPLGGYQQKESRVLLKIRHESINMFTFATN